MRRAKPGVYVRDLQFVAGDKRQSVFPVLHRNWLILVGRETNSILAFTPILQTLCLRRFISPEGNPRTEFWQLIIRFMTLSKSVARSAWPWSKGGRPFVTFTSCTSLRAVDIIVMNTSNVPQAGRIRRRIAASRSSRQGDGATRRAAHYRYEEFRGGDPASASFVAGSMSLKASIICRAVMTLGRRDF